MRVESTESNVQATKLATKPTRAEETAARQKVEAKAASKPAPGPSHLGRNLDVQA